VICFNGRHQPVKGYDLLATVAKELLTTNLEMVFLITGKEDIPPVVDHPRWIQTGWTSEPQNFLDASDLVVVPNRETYFDLNVLQALALGKPVLLSQTGGNNFFHTFNAKGILFLPELTTDALRQAINGAYSNRHQLAQQASALKQLFQEHFTAARFAADYHRFYLSM
jgi:glycosyltransferase involved in cell wall biosynthesis